MTSIFHRAGWITAGVLALLLVAALGGVVFGGPLDPPTSPGSTQPQVEPRSPIPPVGWNGTFPITITQPGSYFLTRNLTGVSGQDGIDIGASNVTLDLNGFALNGGGTGLVGIAAPSTQAQIEVRGGQVRDWATAGIDLIFATDSRVEKVTATGASTASVGIRVGSGGVVTDCQTRGHATGVAVQSSGVVDNCLVNNAGTTGIYGGDHGTVEHCRVNNTGTSTNVTNAGIYVTGSALVSDNAVDNVVTPSASPLHGIAIFVGGAGNRIIDNHISFAHYGYFLNASGNTVIRNTSYAVDGGFTGGTNDEGPFGRADTITDPWANIDD